MEKIAIVVQRYSSQVNGGAELHARLLAEHLTADYDVVVLTSTAKDYLTWENYYAQGEESVNGVKVLRFKTLKKDQRKSRALFRLLNTVRQKGKLTLGFKDFFPILRYRKEKNRSTLFRDWIESQGPLCPSLVEYIRDRGEDYTAILFFTYLYYPTYYGIQEAKGRSILIPTAHDEPAFYFPGFGELFSAADFIAYNTGAEKELVEKTYPRAARVPSDTVGIGFESPVVDAGWLAKIKPDYRYVVYIGRIDQGKGCVELIADFLAYKKKYPGGLKLVMIGKSFMEVPVSEDIILTGFIDDPEKAAWLAGSQALVIPSRYESLSMVTLEAMSMGKPVLANGHSRVLKEHIDKSLAGYVYNTPQEFDSRLSEILNLSDGQKEEISRCGRDYVEANYSWEIVIGKICRAIDSVKGTR